MEKSWKRVFIYVQVVTVCEFESHDLRHDFLYNTCTVNRPCSVKIAKLNSSIFSLYSESMCIYRNKIKIHILHFRYFLGFRAAIYGVFFNIKTCPREKISLMGMYKYVRLGIRWGILILLLRNFSVLSWIVVIRVHLSPLYWYFIIL